MKNLLKLCLALCVIVAFNGCEDGDNTIDSVLEYQTGAVLRTLSVQNAVLNSSDPTTMFSVTVEEQDGEDGGLFESVDVYSTLRDLTTSNGTTVANDIFVKNIPASTFTNGPNNLPVGTITATFGEIVTAMGLTAADYTAGDLFVIELRLNLTDGRVFGASSSTGSTNGGFFSSPFAYNALITCAPAPGNYTVVMEDSYGDGWQTDAGSGGSGITIDIDGTIVEVGMCSPYGGGAGTFLGSSGCTGPASTSFFSATEIVTIPVGTSSATWNFPGDQYGEIGFEIYAPDGSLLLSVPVGTGTPGLLAVTFCL